MLYQACRAEVAIFVVVVVVVGDDHVWPWKKKRLDFIISLRGFRLFLQFL